MRYKNLLYGFPRNYRKLVIKCALLFGTYSLLGVFFLPGTWHHLLNTCALNRVHDGGNRNIAACSMVILKWIKEELNHFFLLLANTSKQTTPITDHKTKSVEPLNIIIMALLTMLFWRRVESSDFMSIFARWACVTIFCTTPECSVS